MVDVWTDQVISHSSPVKSSATPTSSPARASRSKGLSNNVAHTQFTRNNSVTYTIGDVVIIGPDAQLRQKWLGTPEHQLLKSSAARARARRRESTAAPSSSTAQAKQTSWYSEDGLKAGEKVGVITAMYEDASGQKMAQMRWFARPSSVWGPRGPEDGEQVQDYELYYTSDSSYLDELRSYTAWKPGMLLASSRPDTRGSLCSDSVPISTITRHARVLEDGEQHPVAAHLDSSTDERVEFNFRADPVFIVRKVYDTRPIAGAEWFGEIEWADVWRRGKKTGEWDVEAIMIEEDEDEVEDDEVVGSTDSPARNSSTRAGSTSVQTRSNASSTVAESQPASRSVSASPSKRRAVAVARAAQPVVKKQRTMKEESDSEGRGSNSSDDDDDEGNFVPGRTRRRGRGVRGQEYNDDDDDDDDDEDDDGQGVSDDDLQIDQTTPRRRTSARRAANGRTPTRRVRPRLTDASRRRRGTVARKTSQYRRKIAVRNDAVPNALPPAFLESNPHLMTLPPSKRAQALLHVSATPEFLPCREKQRDQVASFIAEHVLSGTGGCLYIHGVPGTGKTATVHSVVRELQNDSDMEPFTFVEINGMKIAEPSSAFSLLWESLSGTNEKLPPRQALSALDLHFREPHPGRKTTVVLVDELDQMITKKQDVVYNFFNWPHVAHSRLIVIAVANTMDLPERELSGKIRSRLGTNRIVFTPYKWEELQQILNARLGDELRTRVFEPRAIEMIAKKVAAGAGDARRALDIARRTAEKVEQFNDSSGQAPRLCGISDANSTYKEMTEYGSNAFLKSTSLQMKVFLFSLSQCIKRSGVTEVALEDVITHHLRFIGQTALCAPPPHSTLFTLVAALHSQRLIVTESQRADWFQKVRPLVSNSELYDMLREDGKLKAWVPKE